MKKEFMYEDHHFQCFVSVNTGNFLHMQKEVELLYAIEGDAKVMYQSKEYIMKQGDIILIFPYTIHRVQKLTPLKYLLCTFDINKLPYFTNIFERLVVEECPILNVKNLHSDVYESFEKISTRKELQKESNITYGHLTIIMEHLLSNLSLVKRSDKKNQAWLSETLMYLNDNFKDTIRLDDIAEHLNLNKYFVSRNFNKILGCNIEKYVNIIRIEHAKNLLSFSTYSITEIALESGFENISTFYRVFRDLGLGTPRQFRKDNANITF